MSSNKYADLPDIDTAPDVYETEDVIPSTQTAGEDSDEEVAPPQRGATRGRTDIPGKEEIDSSSLNPEEASKRFRKAERKRDRTRTLYAYPPSRSSSPEEPANARPLPLAHRLRNLQNELAALETELADPSNPVLAKEREVDNVDPGELIRGLVDVRGRLDKIRKEKEGRAKLLGAVMGDSREVGSDDEEAREKKSGEQAKGTGDEAAGKPEVKSIVEMDRRVGELEKLVGSSSAALDETSPLPPPLLPLISRLNAQLTILTQPRHIDSISRRLKLLLSDLDRASAQHSHRRQASQANGPTQPSALQEQLLPLLSRLGPSLPQIPHILTRLRTLAALHTSAAEFQETLASLEQEQQKMHEALTELDGAVKTVEISLEENRSVVRGNVAGLESRVDALLSRLEQLSRTPESS
ncbi:hypothetical protein H0H81_000354 [Sphagnurus paluster]|uniref:Dynactin subunit 2 n=1 Tax=Sphagnurus paluster TaxID=117069 RepID=A0A9P7GJ04_9AGAR|nr:hypothetical protein H0H81_000354 [Sphagnurus paluster]